jgi:Xaa-Pro aminopeptidase
MSFEIPKAEYETRVKTVKEKMKEQDLGALAVYSYKSAATKYLSGYSPRWSVTNAALYLLPVDGEPLMLTRLQFHLPTVLREAVIPNVKVCGAARLGTTPMDAMAEEGAAFLSEQGKNEGKIGLVGYPPELGIELPLRKALPKAAFVNANPLLEAIRRIKSENEIRLITKSAAASTYAMGEAMQAAKAGVFEQEVLIAAESAMRRKGASAVHLFFGTVKDTKTYHRPVNRRLEKGDIARIEGIPEVGGYCAETTGHFAIESAPPELKAKFEEVVNAHFATVDYMQPGRTIGEVVVYMKTIGSEVSRRLGHGMGLDNIESPETIQEQDKTVIEPGMVFSIHPHLRVETATDIVWGGTVIVTKKGAYSTLSRYPEFVT